jgi:hypothetical protein
MVGVLALNWMLLDPCTVAGGFFFVSLFVLSLQLAFGPLGKHVNKYINKGWVD